MVTFRHGSDGNTPARVRRLRFGVGLTTLAVAVWRGCDSFILKLDLCLMVTLRHDSGGYILARI